VKTEYKLLKCQKICLWHRTQKNSVR